MNRHLFGLAIAFGLLAASAGTTVSLHGLTPHANTAANEFWTTTGRVCTDVSQESGVLGGELDLRTRSATAGTATTAVNARVKVSALSNTITLRTTMPSTLLLLR